MFNLLQRINNLLFCVGISVHLLMADWVYKWQMHIINAVLLYTIHSLTQAVITQGASVVHQALFQSWWFGSEQSREEGAGHSWQSLHFSNIIALGGRPRFRICPQPLTSYQAERITDLHFLQVMRLFS